MKKEGSMTVYACLMLAVLLPLVLASLKSVQIASARVQIASATDQGMYSLFSQYEPQILEWYDLFLMDGGYGTGELRQDQWYESVRRDTAHILKPEEDTKLLGKSLHDIEIKGGGISGYLLATDMECSPVRNQILDSMKEDIGLMGIKKLVESYRKEEVVSKEQKKKKYDLEKEKSEEKYEEERKKANEKKTNNDAAQVASDFVNPIDTIRSIQKQGILSLVIPEEREVSEGKIKYETYSQRSAESGMNIIKKTERSATDRFLIAEYLKEKCDYFTNVSPDFDLKYHLEYIVHGRNSDVENLKGTIKKLLLIREASNLMFLLTDQAKRAEAEAAAFSIAGALLIPVSQPVITKLLQLCWAFGESILDVRELLDGGKISLIKDSESWQLDLSALAEVLTRGESLRHSSKNGKSYQEYLAFLLTMQDQNIVIERFADIIEYRMRTEGKKPDFRMDNCVTAMEVELDCEIYGEYHATVRRGYDYQQ